MERSRRQRGSLTVEAVILFPIIFICLYAIIYLSILLYENSVASAEATRAANRAASYWSFIDNSGCTALQTGEVSAESLITPLNYYSRSPYRFVFETIDTISNSSKRQENTRRYAYSVINGIQFNKYQDNPSAGGNNAAPGVTVSVTHGFLTSYVSVEVQRHYLNPLGSFLMPVGVKEKQDYTAKAQSVITNPSEFIRNYDLIYDIGTGLFSVNPKEQ